MLALYVAWHLKKAGAPICFSDETPPERPGPVAPATRAKAALAKVHTKRGADGEAVHSFKTQLLLGHPRIGKDLLDRATELLDGPPRPVPIDFDANVEADHLAVLAHSAGSERRRTSTRRRGRRRRARTGWAARW
jgi:hypothetical protein